MVHPRVELFRWLRDDPECHVGMLQAAEFRTLATIFAWTGRLKPFERSAARNQIALSLQTGDPEAVNDVVRISPYRNGLTDGDVNFVRGLENAAWIVTYVA